MTTPPSPTSDPRPFYRRKRVRIPAFLAMGSLAAAAILLAGLVGGIFWRAQARDRTAQEWRALYREDVAMVRIWAGQLGESAAALEALAAGAPAGVTTPLSPEDRAAALGHWARVRDLALSLQARADFHRDFVLWLGRDRRIDHVRGFLLCDAADLLVQDAILRIADAMAGERRWQVILNEAQPDWGMAGGEFDRVRARVVNVERTGRQLAARQYRQGLRLLPEYADAAADAEGAWLDALVDGLHDRVRDRLLDRGPSLAVNESADVVGDAAFEAWFPVQKGVANAMGNIRVKRPGVYFATPDQIRELRRRMQPGDIVLTRKNWYASNAGIPGFWPHAMLHVGAPAELAAFFDDPAALAWVARQDPSVADLPALLERRHPDAWAAYAGDGEADGPPNCILEAIAGGVGFHPAGESMNADAVGVLRPLLSRDALACAVDRAFAHFGKPYDYNFDFTSDSALVCSELVFKAYQPSGDFPGLNLQLDAVLGRPTLPPTRFVQKLDAEWGSPAQQLDFVGFLDPRESSSEAVWGTLEEFRSSWRRPKWSAEIQ